MPKFCWRLLSLLGYMLYIAALTLGVLNLMDAWVYWLVSMAPD